MESKEVGRGQIAEGLYAMLRGWTFILKGTKEYCMILNNNKMADLFFKRKHSCLCGEGLENVIIRSRV